MATLTEGQIAIMQRIAQAGLPAAVVWPDSTQSPDLPRIVMQPSGGSQRTATIRGTTEARPEVVARVETLEGDFANTSNDLVADLVALFPAASRFGDIVIMDAPLPRPPLPSDGGAHIVPVIITGWTTF